MHPPVVVGIIIALTIARLSSPPVAFHWRAEDAVVEAVSVSPNGIAAGFWCEGLHGASARCFAQLAGSEPVPIFRGGAIDAADRGLTAPFTGVRHFSMTRGNIAWNRDVPIFSVACHTATIMGVCQQSLGNDVELAGPTSSPLDARVARLGSTTVWNDADISRTIFRAGDRQIAVCCAGNSATYTVTPAPGGDLLLIYAAPGRAVDLRAAVLAPDLAVAREIILAHDIPPPTDIAAVSAGNTLFVVWSGGGIFAAVGANVVKLSDAGDAPAIATDGQRVIAAWLQRGAVFTAELSRPDLARSLLALGSATAPPFLTLDCSAKTGFVAHWRTHSAASDHILIAARTVP